MRDDQHVALMMPAADRLHHAHGPCGHMKRCFSSRSPAACDIVGPIFEGLWPSLLDLFLPQSFPLAVTDFFQSFFGGRRNAGSAGQGIRGLTSTQHRARIDGLPRHRRIGPSERLCHFFANRGERRIGASSETVLSTESGLAVPDHIKVHRVSLPVQAAQPRAQKRPSMDRTVN